MLIDSVTLNQSSTSSGCQQIDDVSKSVLLGMMFGLSKILS